MAKSCPLPKQQEEVESYIAERLAAVRTAFIDVFGVLENPGVLGVIFANNTIQEKQNLIANLKDQLLVAQDPAVANTKEIKRLKDEIAKAEEVIKNTEKKIIQNEKSAPIIKEIEELLVQQVIELMDSRFGSEDVNPTIIMEVLKDSVFTRLTKRYSSLSDMDPNTLIGVKKILEDQLKAQVLESKKERKTLNKFGTWLANTMWHPLVVARTYDATGRAYSVIKGAIELAEKAFSARARHVSVLSDVNEALWNLIEGRAGGQEYMFMHEPGDNITETDKRMSLRKIWEFLTELGTGEVRNIQPTPMFARGKDGQLRFTKEFMEDIHTFNSIVDANAQNGVGVGGWIQEYVDPVSKKVYRYVVIKKTNEQTGEEIYRAYTAPWNDEFNALEKAPGTNNLEFYRQFQSQEEDTIGGFLKWNNTTQKFDLIPGVMPAGFYRATDHRALSGTVQWETKKSKRKKGDEFTTNSDMDFVYDEEINNQTIDPSIWSSLKKIRNLLQETRQDVIEKTQAQELRMIKVLQKLLPNEKFSKKNYSQKQISQLLAEAGVDIDQLDMNITVRNGRIYTHNTDFAELENYWPMKYQFHWLLKLMFESNTKIEEKIEQIIDQINALEGEMTPEAVDERTALTEEMELLEAERNYNNDVINYRLGLTTERPKFNQVTQIKAVKSRTAISKPMKQHNKVTIETGDGPVTTMAEQWGGMRKDSGVMNEYLKETHISLEQNEVKLLLLEAMAGGLDGAMLDYTIDHVRAAFGHKDVQSAFLFINLKKIADTLGITEGTRLFKFIQFTNKMISATFLDSPWTSATNNMQRMGYHIVATAEDAWQAYNMTEEQYKEVQKYAALAGITDEIATLTDVVMGESNAQEAWYSGMGNKAHMLILLATSSKQDFVRKALNNKFWFDIASKLAERIDEPDLGRARELALMDIWELTVGLKKHADDKGPMTEPQKAAFIKTLNGALTEKVVDQQLAFAFKGSALMRLTGLAKRVPSLVTFTESEKRMREEALFIAARVMMREGAIDQAWIDSGRSVYEHPEVVRYARLMVNNVMFQMSKANLSKAFHGPLGELFGKFKPYMWNQIGAEYNIVSNWFAQFRGTESYADRARMFRRIFYKPQGEIEKQVHNFLLGRGLIGLFTGFMTLPHSMTWTPGRSMFNSVLKYTGLGYRPFNSISRGGSSQLAEMLIKMWAFSMAMGGAFEDDEEEKVYQEWFRYFLPIMFNIMIDTVIDEDPFKAIEIYSETAHDVLYDAYKMAAD